MKLKGIKFNMNSVIISSIIIAVMVLIDQISKIIAFKYFEFGTIYKPIPKVIDFILVRNRGAIFGILQGQMVLFWIVTILGLLLFGFLMKDADFIKMPFYSIGLSLMIAGTIGNFIDRAVFGYVRDFITFGFFDFPSFNTADMCMCVGIVMLIIDILFGEAGKLWN